MKSVPFVYGYYIRFHLKIISDSIMFLSFSLDGDTKNNEMIELGKTLYCL